MNEIVLGAIGFGVAMLLVGLMYCVLDWLHARKVAARFDERHAQKG